MNSSICNSRIGTSDLPEARWPQNEGTDFQPQELTDVFKYGRMQKGIPSWLVCDSCSACLDGTLPGVQVTTGPGFFSVFKII